MTNTARRGRPSPEVSRQKLAEVLAAAREEFSRRGYRAVTIRGVAERSQVSTRTVYNHHKDKLSLFKACLDVGATDFPQIAARSGEAPAAALRRFATELIEMLASDSSMRISMLVYREGAEFPELAAAAEANQERHLVEPLAAFISANGLGGSDAREDARLFNTMATAEWQRAAIFGHALPDREQIERYVARIVDVFLHGAGRASSAGEEQEA